MSPKGKLFVVATPIGNLEDLSPRARSTLRGVSAIFCEDTRVTARLASRFGFGAPRYSCHGHNEASRIPALLERLARGEQVAYVSDAGTPAVSDPGERLVAAAAAAGHEVVAVPGPSAAAAALSISGMPAVPHLFLGFPPARGGARRAFFQGVRDRSETLVFFEAPHRLAASLADAARVFGERETVVARELTKVHEETIRGGLPEIALRVARSPVLGECVIVLRGAAPNARAPATEAEIDAEISRLADSGRSPRERAREIARRTGVSSREIYARMQQTRRPTGDRGR